ncbi:LysE family translocator [Bordetella petrii]|nr:LysE family translocator [Bordetella petrii]
MRIAAYGIAGAALSDLILIGAVGCGLGAIMQASEHLFAVLKWVGAAYLLYLAWRIGTSGEVKAHGGKPRPRTFIEAAAFQWINPKAWMMVLTAATTVRLSGDYGMNAAWMAVVFILIGFPCICLWAAFGLGLRLRLVQGRLAGCLGPGPGQPAHQGGDGQAAHQDDRHRGAGQQGVQVATR